MGVAKLPAAARATAAAAPVEVMMLDFAMLALGFVFFASAIGYVLLCERL